MTDEIIISVEGLGKKYLIGHKTERESYVALRDVIARKARNVWRQTAGMAHGREVIAGYSIEEFWALKDVSFEIKRGEVLGIIGHNGAGKSTLLKILSRITEPSEGRVIIDGRVASLLEVGTGFHPELTGRENILLNGALLGMTRAEIKRKFHEIVAFAEVENFLDTPVKRYSSGMYVRLAFAVAAHLEPEIIIIDEILAVGDVEFQKKCLGKISEVASSGRTVLFVSHNLAAVSALTQRAVWLDKGKVSWVGPSDQTIEKYSNRSKLTRSSKAPAGRGRHTQIRTAELVDAAGRSTFSYEPGTPFRIAVCFTTDGTPGMSMELFLNDPSRRRLGFTTTLEFDGESLPRRPGMYRCLLSLSPLWLAAGNYVIDLATSIPNVTLDHLAEGAIEFDVHFCNPGGLARDYRHDHEFGSIALHSMRPPIVEPCEDRHPLDAPGVKIPDGQ